MHAQRCLKLCVMQTAESDFAVSSCTPWSNSGGHDDTAKSVEKFCFLDSPPQSMKPRCPPCTCTLHSAHCRERMVELRARISRKYRNCIRKYFNLFFKGQMRISNEKISILIHYLQTKKLFNFDTLDKIIIILQKAKVKIYTSQCKILHRTSRMIFKFCFVSFSVPLFEMRLMIDTFLNEENVVVFSEPEPI